MKRAASRLTLFVLFCFLMQICTYASAYGQGQVAKGKVTGTSGEALIGVNVLIKGTLFGTITDVRGEYTLPIPSSVSNPILLFSYVGMNPQEIAFSGQNEVNVKMSQNVAIEGVVITGMFDKPKESFTGAVTMVTAAQLEAAGTRSMLTSLQNLDPTFNILENNMFGSDPNNIANMSITMRGASSLSDIQSGAQTAIKANMPLFIVDYFETSLERVLDMDQTRVESITILKDASATALYGSRGSNGVIVITTKRPEAGKIHVTYKGSVDFEAPDLSSYNLMNAREKLEYEKAAGIYDGTDIASLENRLNLYNRRMLDVERGVDTYWLKYPTRLGVGQKHTVTVEGGENAIRYSASAGYNNIKGTMKGSERNNFNGDMFLSYTVKKLIFSNKLSVTRNKAFNSPYGKFSTYGKMNSYFSPYDENGNIIQDLDPKRTTGYNGLSQNTRNNMNPLWNAKLNQRDDSQYTEIVNNFLAEWHIIPHELYIRGKFNISRKDSRVDLFLSPDNTAFMNYAEEDHDRKGKYTYTTGNANSYEGDISLNYLKTFHEKHQLTAGAMFNISEKTTEVYRIIAEGLTVPSSDFLGMAAGYQEDGFPYGSETIVRSARANATANYTYDSRYYVDVSGTIDGSSQFGAEKRTGFFWSAGAGWSLHKEKFLENSKVINLARLRFSAGRTGSAGFSPYQAMSMYTYQEGITYKGWYGEELLAYGNPYLKWETTNSQNIGADLSILDSRLNVTFNAYNKKTNIIADITMPSSSGFSSYKGNVGKVQNRGIELDLQASIIRNREKDFHWTVGVALRHNKNEIVKISDALEALNEKNTSTEGLTEDEANDLRRSPSFLYKEGESLNTIFAVRSKGIDPATGNEIFVTRNGVTTFTWDPKDLVACGIDEATVFGNINTTVRYKGLALTAYFQYETGGSRYNSTLADKIENIHPYQNADKRVLYDRWKQVGDIAYFKTVTDYSNTNATSRFVMKNKVFRCSAITLKYDVPTEWTRKHLKINYISFQGTVQDVFYFSTIKRERGLDYPFSNKFSFSTSIRF